MFENDCDIRSEFLSRLKDLFRSNGESKGQKGAFVDIDLPKKEGIFQHIPLYNLYQNSFVLPNKGKVKKEEIRRHILKEALFSNLVLVDGEVDLSLSDLSCCKDLVDVEAAGPLDNPSQEEKTLAREYNFFVPLNRLFAKKELRINIKKKPPLLQLINVVTSDVAKNSLISPRIIINFCENSFADIYFSGCNLSENSSFWINGTVYLNPEKGSSVNFYSDFSGFEKAYLFNSIRGSVKKEGELNLFSAMNGGKIEHHDLKLTLDEKGAKCRVGGIFLLKEGLQSHLNVNIEHKAEHTQSHQLIKSILKDSSRSGFEAKVLIEKKAQGSVSRQLNKNLLLSEHAEAFSKPFLQVFVDDVKASHGATIHRLDEEQLFYLASKGLAPSSAEYLLVKGFCQEILNLVNIKNIKEILEERMVQYLG